MAFPTSISGWNGIQASTGYPTGMEPVSSGVTCEVGTGIVPPFPGSWCEGTCPASQQQSWDSIQACAVVKTLSGHCTRPSTCTHDHEKTERAGMRPRRQRGLPMGGGRLEAKPCVCLCQGCLQWSACECALERQAGRAQQHPGFRHQLC